MYTDIRPLSKLILIEKIWAFMTIRDNALKIVKTLKKAGYTAYFAGGWVRDFIMNHPSEDIDIATDAPPNVVISLFPKTILVGVAFGVVIVVMNGHQFEVATFRKDLEYISGRRPEGIEHSNAEEDALRRDFTINGMFYDPLNDIIIDFVNGKEDIEKGIIRTIGSAHERFAEDRLRMVRAIRFASRFGFKIHEETQLAIQSHAITLFPAVAMERIWQEFHKMSKSPRFDQALLDMHRLGLLPVIFPTLQGLDVKEIANRVVAFQQFPKNSPAILYLMELFPQIPLDQLLEIGQYLKISGHEGKLVEFAYKGKLLLTKEEIDPHNIESIEWTKFYSDRFFQTCFEFLTAGFPHEKRSELIERHTERRERLLPHIQRMLEKKPLVTALILQDYGILPGKEMGNLLKEAEKLAIKHDMHDPAAVVAMLKNTHLWPEGV